MVALKTLEVFANGMVGRPLLPLATVASKGLWIEVDIGNLIFLILAQAMPEMTDVPQVIL